MMKTAQRMDKPVLAVGRDHDGPERISVMWISCTVIVSICAGIGVWLAYNAMVYWLLSGEVPCMQYLPFTVWGLSVDYFSVCIGGVEVLLRRREAFEDLSAGKQASVLGIITVLTIAAFVGSLTEFGVIG